MSFIIDVYDVLSDIVFCCLIIFCCLFFFFQAEDGIRDLVRSRGLGDVYKRQGYYERASGFKHGVAVVQINGKWGIINQKGIEVIPVSYTHLTLPTSDLV